MSLSFHPLVVLAVVLVLAAGCASSASNSTTRYDASAAVTHFRSNPVPLQMHVSNDPLGGRRNLSVRAFASCPGQQCTPEVVTFSFMNPGSSPVSMNFSTLQLQADNVSQTWEDIWLGGQGQRSVPGGEFLRVDVPAAFFRHLAEAREVRVVLGSTVFRIHPSARRAFRIAAEEMNIPSADVAADRNY